MRVIASLISAFGLVLSAVVVAPPAQAAVAYATISASGPIKQVHVGADLGCQVRYGTDTAQQFYPSSVTPGDCGTFVAVGNTLFAPSINSHGGTATGSLGQTVEYSRISQSIVTGQGTATSPYTVATVVGLPTTSLSIVETDSYVAGRESYQTEVVLKNSATSAVDAIIYRGADCFLGGSDSGYGAVNASVGAVACTKKANNSPADRVEQWVPITGGNSWYQANYREVWAAIAKKTALAGTCRCNDAIDNGAVIAWSVSVPPAGQVIVSHLTNFSSTGVYTRMEAKAVVADVSTANPAASSLWAPTLTAVLTNQATGAPVVGRAVDFHTNGAQVCSAVTGSDGVARCSDVTATARTVAGTRTYRAVFSGDAEFLASAGDATLLSVDGQPRP